MVAFSQNPESMAFPHRCSGSAVGVRMFTRNYKVRRSDSGMSMIELMMAMTLLAVGMAGVMILITSSIASNNRNKQDTTATVLSQMMVERLAAAGVNPTTTFEITDCQSNTITVDPRGNTSGSFDYKGCSAAGTGATYTVNWQVATFFGPTNQPYTRQISVTTRQTGTAGAQLRFFIPPATLRTVIGR